MANPTLEALNETQLELLRRYDNQFRKLEDKANGLKQEWQSIADSAKKQIDTTNKLVNEKIDWADRRVKGYGFTLTVVSAGAGGGTSNSSAGVYINGSKVKYFGRSQNIIVIDIAQQKVVDYGHFDTYGNADNAASCASYIEKVFSKYSGSNYLIIFGTYDEPANHLTDDLKAKVAKHFKATLFDVDRVFRDAYLCVYRNGIGKLAEKKSACGNCIQAQVAAQLQIR